jgi:hypothetical protein
MAIKTLTFSEQAQGWPSFYTFYPDWMIGMNNYFYTFNEGNLYRHNTNPIRNQYYGINYTSYLKLPLNDNPLENKIYKTVALVGDDPWDVLSVATDLQSGGNIDSSWFEEKESTFFSYIRSTNTVPEVSAMFPLRSLTGIGKSSNITGSGPIKDVIFSITPLVDIGTIVSVGDYLYYVEVSTTNPVYFGVITSIVKDYPNNINKIVVDTSGGIPHPVNAIYFLFIKNQVAESLGILGHYCVIELENDSTEKVELFAVQSEVMKSFP